MLAGTANRIADGEAPLATDGAARQRRAHAADGLRAHPRLPVDGDLAALAPPAGHVRRARARAQRLRRARRPGGGARAAARDADGRARPVAEPRRHRGREPTGSAPAGSRSSCCTSPTSSPSPAASGSRSSENGHASERDPRGALSAMARGALVLVVLAALAATLGGTSTSAATHASGCPKVKAPKPRSESRKPPKSRLDRPQDVEGDGARRAAARSRSCSP